MYIPTAAAFGGMCIGLGPRLMWYGCWAVEGLKIDEDGGVA